MHLHNSLLSKWFWTGGHLNCLYLTFPYFGIIFGFIYLNALSLVLWIKLDNSTKQGKKSIRLLILTNKHVNDSDLSLPHASSDYLSDYWAQVDTSSLYS